MPNDTRLPAHSANTADAPTKEQFKQPLSPNDGRRAGEGSGATSGSQSLAFGVNSYARYWFDMEPIGVPTISVDVRPYAWDPRGSGYNYAQYSCVSLIDHNGSAAWQVYLWLYNSHGNGDTQPHDFTVMFSPSSQSSWQIVGNWTLGTPYTISFTKNYTSNTLGISLSALGGGAPLINKIYNSGTGHIGGIRLSGNDTSIAAGTMYVDNLRFGEVPEPSSLIALCALVTPLLALRRRKA